MTRIILALMGVLVALALEPCRAAESLADPALEPPRIIASPGPEFYEVVRQGVPGIERAPNGRLWAMWIKRVESLYGYLVLVTSDDDGRTWSDFRLAVKPHPICRAMSPNVWIDPQGRMWVTWGQTAGMNDGRWGVWAIVTDDPGSASPTWSEPRRIADGIMLNKPTVLSSGDWLLPIGMWKENDIRLGLKPEKMAPYSESRLMHDLGDKRRTTVVRSSDNGKTFDVSGRADIATRVDEPMIVERRDGSVWMLVRSSKGIVQTISTDGGRTWGAEQPYLSKKLVTPSARFFIRRLNSGALLMVRHDGTKAHGRSHLTAYVSDDDGATWSDGLLLDEREHVTYPDGVQAPDGTIYIVYDYDRGGEGAILMTTFREEDARAGHAVSGSVRSRVEINRVREPTN